jgi:hypothetical protein
MRGSTVAGLDSLRRLPLVPRGNLLEAVFQAVEQVDLDRPL